MSGIVHFDGLGVFSIDIQNALQNVMSVVSVRLPDDIELRLHREAQLSNRAKSEIARDAIAEYLKRLERDRFLDAIARAARVRSGSQGLDLAEESLPLDNEALAISENVGGVKESRARYKSRRRKR